MKRLIPGSVAARVVARMRRSALDGVLAGPAAAFDLIAKPSRSRAFGGPLNDQAFRRLIVEGVISTCGLRTVIETGACRGTTTEFFASSGVESVWTIEAVPRLYWYTKLRLRRHGSVRVVHGDSRTALERLARDTAITTRPTLFYLDAHWGPDLPLADEIRIVAANWTHWVIMIDDFRIPDDEGYGYDDYGRNARIDAEYCYRTGVSQLRVFYPKLESRFETGRRRGCAVLANATDYVAALENLDALLRPG